MTVEQFCKTYPRLFHMATGDSLKSIEKYGLLSSRSIIQMLGIETDRATELLTKRRSKCEVLTHPVFGTFTLRDQVPLNDEKLQKCLVGMDKSEWYMMLNSRSFLWATKDRLETLASAKAYRNIARLILTLNSEKFMARYSGSVELSSINSGATFYVPVARGRTTFTPLAEFPTTKKVAEITVPNGIPDFIEYVEEVENR